MKCWIYLCENITATTCGASEEAEAALLKRRGEEGWELAAVHAWDEWRRRYYFKREAPLGLR